MVFRLSFGLSVSCASGSATYLKRTGHMAPRPSLEEVDLLEAPSDVSGRKVSSVAWFRSVEHSKLVKFERSA